MLKKGEYSFILGPWYIVIRPDKYNENLMTTEDQQYYRRLIGSLMYLVILSRLDLSNSVRELSKVMDKSTHKQLKALK
jgi:hypothetical protein